MKKNWCFETLEVFVSCDVSCPTNFYVSTIHHNIGKIRRSWYIIEKEFLIKTYHASQFFFTIVTHNNWKYFPSWYTIVAKFWNLETTLFITPKKNFCFMIHSISRMRIKLLKTWHIMSPWTFSDSHHRSFITPHRNVFHAWPE